MDETLFNINLLEPLIKFGGTISERISKTEAAYTRVCRTCLCETTDNNLESNSFLTNDHHGSLVTIKEMMEVSTGLEINAEDKLPHHICDGCLKTVEAAYSFRTQSQRIDEVLNGFLREMYSIKDEKPSEGESVSSTGGEIIIKPEKIDEPPDIELDADDVLPTSSFHCDPCNMNFPIQDDFVKHNAEHGPTGSKKKLFKCGICAKEYSFRNGLHNHLMITHIQKKEYQCPVCRRIFKKRDRLQQHRKSYCIAPAAIPNESSLSVVTVYPAEKSTKSDNVVVEIKNLTCSLCKEKFELESDFNGHMSAHVADKECDFCKKSFSRATYLESHIRAHTNEKPFVCPICAKGFTSTRTLRSHIKVHSLRAVFTCDRCERKYYTEKELRKHLTTHKNKQNSVNLEETAEIMSCAEDISLKSNDSKNHLYKEEPDSALKSSPVEMGGLSTISSSNKDRTDQEIIMKPVVIDSSICKMEPMDFDTTESICIKEENIEAPNQHVESVSDETFWEQPPDGFEIIIKDEKSDALKIANEPISDDEQSLVDNLEQTITETSEAVSPNIIIDNVKQEIFDDDQRTLNTSNELPSGDETSLDQSKPSLLPVTPAEVFGRFVCGVPECTAVYRFYREIINHYTRQHCSGPPFACPVCTMLFPVKREVRNHLKSHITCEYKCPCCSKGYLTLRDLKIHLRTHTGERPFKCPKCPKRFKQRPALKVHITTHNICKEYKCGICSKEFFSYNGLFLHTKSHKENKELQCPFCAKQFPTKSRLQRHQNGVCGSRTPAKS